MINFLRISSLMLGLVGLLLLSACQPEFVKSESAELARKVGVTNNFTISRWNSRRIETSATIAVVSDDIEQLDAVELSKVVAQNMAPYFVSVTGSHVEDSIASALSLANQHGAQFVLYLEVTDTKPSRKSETQEAEKLETTDSETAESETDSNYKELNLTMTLMDVVSRNTLDKITLTAKTSWISRSGDNMQGLLADPVAKISQDLTGL